MVVHDQVEICASRRPFTECCPNPDPAFCEAQKQIQLAVKLNFGSTYNSLIFLFQQGWRRNPDSIPVPSCSSCFLFFIRTESGRIGKNVAAATKVPDILSHRRQNIRFSFSPTFIRPDSALQLNGRLCLQFRHLRYRYAKVFRHQSANGRKGILLRQRPSLLHG